VGAVALEICEIFLCQIFTKGLYGPVVFALRRRTAGPALIHSTRSNENSSGLIGAGFHGLRMSRREGEYPLQSNCYRTHGPTTDRESNRDQR
jgi:hypothetical protein